MIEQTVSFPLNHSKILNTFYYSSLQNSPYVNNISDIENSNEFDSPSLTLLTEYRKEIDELEKELYQTQFKVYDAKRLLIKLKFKNDNLLRRITEAETKLNDNLTVSQHLQEVPVQRKPTKSNKVYKSLSSVTCGSKRPNLHGVNKIRRTNLIVYEKVDSNIQNILIDRSQSLQYQSFSATVSQPFNVSNEISTHCVKKPNFINKFIRSSFKKLRFRS
jgi:hypothetical protein